MIWYMCVKVMGDKNILAADEAAQADRFDSKQGKKKATDDFKSLGFTLYTYLPLMFFTGSHRLLNFKNFKCEMVVGLSMDMFLYALPIIML